jgi:TonB family protein
MALPEFANQKREQERKSLKVLLTRTLAASLALHVGLLLLNIKPLWTATTPESEEIAIVITEDEEPEEELIKEPPEEELLTGGSGGSPAVAPVEAVEPVALAEPVPLAPIPEPLVEPSPQPTEEPIAESPVEPSPTPTATPTEQPTATPTPTAPTPQRSIQDLLNQLRRDRDARSRSAAVGTPSLPSGTGTGEGTGLVNGSGDGTGNGTGNGSGDGSSNGSGNGSGDGDGEAAAPRSPGQGRRIACRNCPDVDYPEEALRQRQEGTVKVLVDYDENGNVIGATLVDSSGHTVLDEAVLETVRERYRLRDTGGSGSTVLSIDMTIDGSEFNQQAESRGDRRAVDIPPPAPVAEEPTPSDTAAEPIADPIIPAPTNDTPTTPAPESPQEAAAPAAPVPLPDPIADPQPEPPAAAPEPAYVPPPEPAYEEPDPVPLPEPIYEAPAPESAPAEAPPPEPAAPVAP